VIALVYFIIAFRKLKLTKRFIEPALVIMIIGALYVSIFAICRIKINEYIVPIGIFIYIISLLGVTTHLSNENKKIIIEEKKQK